MTLLLTTEMAHPASPARHAAMLRNRLFRRRAPLVLGGARVPRLSLALAAPPDPAPGSAALEITLGGHPGRIGAAWTQLGRLTGAPLEETPPADGALMVEEALGPWLDLWEAATGLETRAVSLAQAPADGPDGITAGLTLAGPGLRLTARLWLSEGAARALADAWPEEPAPWAALGPLLLALRLEHPGPTLSLADLRSLGPGDALLMPETEARLVLENRLAAPVSGPSDAPTLTGPFRPRPPSTGVSAMSGPSLPGPAQSGPARSGQADPGAADATAPADGPASPTGGPDLGQIELRLAFRVGEALVGVDELRRMGPGTTIPLDRPDGDLVDIVVNGRAIGTGALITVSGQRAVEIRRLFDDG